MQPLAALQDLSSLVQGWPFFTHDDDVGAEFAFPLANYAGIEQNRSALPADV